MATDLTLWFLNRINVLDHAPLIQALRGHGRVRLGRRVAASDGEALTDRTVDIAANHAGKSALPVNSCTRGHGLPTNDKHADPTPTRYDEYFVRIPRKCLGKQDGGFWPAVASEQGRVRLVELAAREQVRADLIETKRQDEETRQRRALTREELAKWAIGIRSAR